MNKIKARVEKIKENGILHQINFSSEVGNLSLVSLDLKIKTDQEVILGFKPTAVAVGLNLNQGLSYSNQIGVEILSIEKGEILTKITAFINSHKITSVITTDSANRLNLEIGNKVVFLVKATDIFVVQYD